MIQDKEYKSELSAVTPFPLIDSHQHFWQRSRGDYGWLTPDLKPLWRDFMPEDIVPVYADHHIQGSIVVQAAPTVAETEFLLGLAEKNDFILGVVGWVDMASAGAADEIRRLAENPYLRGIRPMIQDLADDDWMLSGALTPAFETLVTLNLTFDALVLPHHLSRLLTLVTRYLGLKVVIDHGAKPFIKDGRFEPWAEDIRQIAAHPSVYCKLSGMMTEAGAAWTRDQLLPYVDHLFDCFGSTRIMWGSDFPVLNLAGDFSVWFDFCSAYVRAAGSDALFKAVFSQNAMDFYGVKPKPVLYQRLSSAVLDVPTLGLGGAGLGNLYQAITDEVAFATIESAWAEGVRYFDTAPRYGRGLSERRLGQVLSTYPRDQYILSTKVGRVLKQGRSGHDVSMFHDQSGLYEVYDYTYNGIMQSFNSSLDRLQTDYIDLLLVHDIGRFTHGELHEAMLQAFLEGGRYALHDLRRQGRIRAVGLGVNEWEIAHELFPYMSLDFIMLAGRYTLLEQNVPAAFFEACRERGTQIIVAGPYNSGILAGGDRYNYAPAEDHVIRRVSELRTLCESHQVKLQDAAAQFPLRHTGVASVVVGAQTVDEILSSVRGSHQPISEALWEALEELNAEPIRRMKFAF